jgi:mono/diheme cytochrome c family protein
VSGRYLAAGVLGLVLVAAGGVALAQAGANPTGNDGEALSQPPARPPAPDPVTLIVRPDAGPGEARYVDKCAMCHAPGGMGHGLLARRLDTPDLERRDNLPAAYVVLAARQGIGNMPAIPRGEASDEDLQLIADYLAAGPHEVGQ